MEWSSLTGYPQLSVNGTTLAVPELTSKNLMDAGVKHRGKCCNTGKWKHSVNLPFTMNQNIECGISFQRCTAQQTLSLCTTGLGNELKLKLKLPSFSLSHILCNMGFGFGFVIFYLLKKRKEKKLIC